MNEHLKSALAQLNGAADWNERTGGTLCAKLTPFEARAVLQEVARLTADRDDWKAKHWKAHDDFHRQFLEMEEFRARLRYLSELWNPKTDFRNDEIGKWIVIGDHNRMIAAIDAARAAGEGKP